MYELWQNKAFILHGLQTTLEVTVLTLLFATIISVVLGIFSSSSFAVTRRIISVYVEVLRDTPLIVTVFIVFFIAPKAGLSLSPFWSIVTALSLWGGANGTEIVRSSIDSVSQHQWEGAKALGFRFTSTLFVIIFPQAIRTIIPPYLGIMALLVQGTALGALVGVEELLHSAQSIVEQSIVMNGQSIAAQVYLIILLVYFGICFAITRSSQWAQRRFDRAGNSALHI